MTPTPDVIITPSQDDIDLVNGYRVTKWHDYKNYECIRCQYKTLTKSRMDKHLERGQHPWAYPGQYKRPDPSGEQVVERDTEQEMY